jgi:hypothetical protein
MSPQRCGGNLQRFMAECAGATIHVVAGSHAIYVSRLMQ